MSEYLSPNQAVEVYDLQQNRDGLSEFGRELAEHGIVTIERKLSDNDFKALSEGFAVCLNECPELLRATAHAFDNRYGSDAGYVRKEKKIDQRSGIQTSDSKNYFHFSEAARSKWNDDFKNCPKVLKDFLSDGYEIHDALISLAKEKTTELESSHPNMSQLYFPGGESSSVLRLLRYDAYEVTTNLGDVASSHYDIAGQTYQAYADAPGFWAAKDGVTGERVRFDSKPDEASMFFGKGHERVYGKDDAFKPLWHGVDRIIPAGVTLVPERTAVILFVNMPRVDYLLREEDTRPYLNKALAKAALSRL